MKYRIEHDTIGEVQVPADKFWGAQTERSRNNFKIGPAASMPMEIIEGFAYLKKAAAYANCDLGVLSQEKRDAIAEVCDEILEGKLFDQFPLVIWQTGSGTQSNMNCNEVIANKAQFNRHGSLGGKEKLIQNVTAFMETIVRLKPASSKGTYLKGIAISTTMGPGIRIDTAAVKDLVK